MFKAHFSRSTVSFLALALAACGGEASGPTAPPTTSNQAPTFTGQSSITTPENVVDLGVVGFSDPDGDTLSYSILSTGDDFGPFLIGGDSGRLAFNFPANFELPQDGNEDNVYTIEVEARDSAGNRTTQQLTITVTDETGRDDERYVHEAFANVQVESDIAFGRYETSPGNFNVLFMDVFSPPASADTERRRPVMILAFGGGFFTGDRSSVEREAERFARRGWVAATVDYSVLGRQANNGDELIIQAVDSIHDVAAAVRFFREDGLNANEYGVDPDAIFVGGESAGGTIAASLATVEIDEVDDPALKQYIIDNGGIAGRSSDNFDTVSSEIQGAFLIAGSLLDIDVIDATSKPIFAAHFELDPITPCESGPEGLQNTGVILYGGCAIADRYASLGLPYGAYLVPGIEEHVDFNIIQLDEIITEAGRLFVDEVIAP
ncbi:carboxylesterase family protein [Sphingomicrobium arenosum]|uniref:carboxylesterase family protein n=1 Tax=Sphingomicrobium arenosum TaxID=2233861 RepID=UPI0022400092|nr:carboxylesterase family protein [Sphingomicrobium arenosum]